MRVSVLKSCLALVTALAALLTCLAVGNGAQARASTDVLGSHVMFGAAVPDLPAGRTDLPELENELGAHLQIASAFVDWSYVIGGPNELWMADKGTRRVLLSWEPYGVRFADVTSGKEDSYLQRVATSMAAYPYDVYVRPWPEMNANWSSWQPTAAGTKTEGGTPAQFVAAWQYLVNYFRSRGVSNLKFVFDPDASNWSTNTPISSIWPGSTYVDALGIDGYNWGNDSVGDTWRSFDTIFSNMYSILTGLDATHPVWIAETGSKEPQEEDDSLYPQESAPIDPANSKGTWINQMLASSGFPRVTAIAWFDKKKERDWRLDSSADALSVIKSYLSTAAPSPSASPSPTATPTPTSTAPSAGQNVVQNPSLEADADGDGIPDCYDRRAVGTQTDSWAWTAGHTGARSERLIVKSYVSGSAGLMTSRASGCAIPAGPGASPSLSLWYQSSSSATLQVWYLSSAGHWSLWRTGPSVRSKSWHQLSWTTPALPSDTVAISFGLSLAVNGTLLTDDYTATG